VVAQKKHPSFFIRWCFLAILFVWSNRHNEQLWVSRQCWTISKWVECFSMHPRLHETKWPKGSLGCICMRQSDQKVLIVWECANICRGNLFGFCHHQLLPQYWVDSGQPEVAWLWMQYVNDNDCKNMLLMTICLQIHAYHYTWYALTFLSKRYLHRASCSD
jgi:hypothetical protein